MGKLHELLAVEGELEKTYVQILKETINTFLKKANLFIGFHKRLEVFNEKDAEKLMVPDEQQRLEETVHGKLSYMAEHSIRYFDAVLQKECTNQLAKADLFIDDLIIAKDLPATFLLGLEKRLKSLRNVYLSIPTLQPGKKWIQDIDAGDHIYKDAQPNIRYKTAKTFQHKVLYAATEHHPAQVEHWEETENVGKYILTTWCGMISPAEKSMILGRIDKLIQATKKARQRANTTKVEKRTIVKEIFDYINAD